MSPDERINAYLDRVCCHIKWRPCCARVRRELTDHILTRAEYLCSARGFSDTEAVIQAIRLLGDPDEVGRALDRAHKPYERLCLVFATCILWAGIVYCVVMLLLHLPI